MGKITQPFISLFAKTPRQEGGLSGSIRAVSPFDPPQTPDKDSGARGAGGRLLPVRGEGFPPGGRKPNLAPSKAQPKNAPFSEPLELGRNSLQIPWPPLASEKMRVQPNSTARCSLAPLNEFKTITREHVFPMKGASVKTDLIFFCK